MTLNELTSLIGEDADSDHIKLNVDVQKIALESKKSSLESKIATLERQVADLNIKLTTLHKIELFVDKKTQIEHDIDHPIKLPIKLPKDLSKDLSKDQDHPSILKHFTTRQSTPRQK